MFEGIFDSAVFILLIIYSGELEFRCKIPLDDGRHRFRLPDYELVHIRILKLSQSNFFFLAETKESVPVFSLREVEIPNHTCT